MEAPLAPRHPHVRTVHDETVTDDWFYLRDRQHPETIPYLEAENRYTEARVAQWQKLQDELYVEMVGRIQETDTSVPWRRGESQYYTRTEQGKQYGIFCRQAIGGGDEQVLLDGNALAEGHEYFSLAFHHVSPDGNTLAYAINTDGSEVFTLRFRDLRTGEEMPGQVAGVYYSATWANDSQTFFFTTLDETKRPWRLWRCVAGSAELPVLVFEEPDGRFNVGIDRSRSGAYLFLTVGSHTTSEVWCAPGSGVGSFFRIQERRQDVEYYVEHQGPHLFMRTNEDGRNFRLLRAPAAQPEQWTEVIAHRTNASLEQVDGFADYLVVTERVEGLRRLRVMAGSGEHDVTFDEPAYTFSPEPNEEYDSNLYRFSYSSLTTPRSVYDYDMQTRSRTLLKRYAVLGGFDPSNYVSERLTATSHDGVKVPISVVCRRGFKRDGSAPLYLYGYGSYGIVTDPAFSSERISLLDRGFVFAIAHIRGSGDMGRLWYEDGKLGHKKNTFLDFIACAEHLIAQQYTAAARLAIAGGSAGGLLMGAVTNLRPDLFRSVVAHVPFVDVVNTMLDDTLPLTVTEYEEWGNPNTAADYAYIRSYAPYENVTAAAYPNILATAGLNDPRVPYWEPAKWIASLRRNNTGYSTILLKTQMGAGHGGPSGRYEKLREKAFEYAFVIGSVTGS
ncbi:MAG: oligopeptidase Serine peptidase family [Bryobacterales bacterium]|nr:oligopeptidase Serine peptidase family [Bryobacterales bacterium]